MSGKQWAIMLIASIGAGAGVFLGADVKLDDWADMNVPRLIIGAILSISSSIGAFLSTPPPKK